MASHRLNLDGDIAYANKALNLLGAGVIGLWPLNETSGSVAQELTNARAITYNGPTLQAAAGPALSMGNAPSFSGSSQSVDFPAGTLTALNTANVFKPGEGGLSVWAKMLDAGHWASATQFVIAQFSADGNNKFTLLKDAANRVSANFVVGGNFTTPNSALSTLLWFHIGMTWSVSANKMRFYVNGAQIGADSAYTGTWAGSLAAAETHIGSGNGSAYWPGWIDQVVLCNRMLTASEMTVLASPN